MSQNGNLPPSRGENKTYLSCHHLEDTFCLRRGPRNICWSWDVRMPKLMGIPQIIQFHKGFPLFSPSILGENPYFWFNTQIYLAKPSGPVQPHYLQRLVLGVLCRNLAVGTPKEVRKGKSAENLEKSRGRWNIPSAPFDPSESVFWAGFYGLNTSSKGIWSTRVLPGFFISLIFQFPIYLEPGVYLIIWHAWESKVPHIRELEDQGRVITPIIGVKTTQSNHPFFCRPFIGIICYNPSEIHWFWGHLYLFLGSPWSLHEKSLDFLGPPNRRIQTNGPPRLLHGLLEPVAVGVNHYKS